MADNYMLKKVKLYCGAYVIFLLWPDSLLCPMYPTLQQIVSESLLV